MFLFPAIALAMYKTAYKENKAYVKSMLVTMVLTAFLGNVTEPLEYTFDFLAPVLYLVYALIVGVGAMLVSFADVGIGGIRGTVFDIAIVGLLFENSNWISLVIIGTILAAITYFIFKWSILRLPIITSGRVQ